MLCHMLGYKGTYRRCSENAQLKKRIRCSRAKKKAEKERKKFEASRKNITLELKKWRKGAKIKQIWKLLWYASTK